VPEPEQLPPLGAEPSAAPAPAAEERPEEDGFDPAEMTVRLGAADPLPEPEPLPETPAEGRDEAPEHAAWADDEKKDDEEDDEFESTVRLQPGPSAPDEATVRLGAEPRGREELAEHLGEAAPPAEEAAPPAEAARPAAETGSQESLQGEQPPSAEETAQPGNREEPAAGTGGRQPYQSQPASAAEATQDWNQPEAAGQWQQPAAGTGGQPVQQWEQPQTASAAEATQDWNQTPAPAPEPAQWDPAATSAEAPQPVAGTGGQQPYQWEQPQPASAAEATQDWDRTPAPAPEPAQWEAPAASAESGGRPAYRQDRQPAAPEPAWWDPSSAPAEAQPSAETGGRPAQHWDQGQAAQAWDQAPAPEPADQWQQPAAPEPAWWGPSSAPAEAAQPAAGTGGQQPYQGDQAPAAEPRQPAAADGRQYAHWDQALTPPAAPGPEAGTGAPAPQQWEQPAEQGPPQPQYAQYQQPYSATGQQQPYQHQMQQQVQQPYEQPPVPQGPEDLDTAALVRGGGARKNKPGKGWRKAVHAMSLGLVNPGESAADKRRNELVARARTHVAGGHHRVAVLSLKGGVGKTTTTVALGSMLASLRGDRVLAVDANPDRGTLSDKVRLETAATIRDLLNEQHMITRYADIRGFTSQAMSRLEILASDRDPAVYEAFSESDYREVSRLLEHYYSICLTDCGTGLLHSAMRGVLGLADQVVLVSSPSVDGARSASATLDWLEAHEYGYLVRGAVVVLSMVRPSGKSSVDLDRLEQHFASRCRAVVRVPWDSHLEEGAEVDLDRLAPNTRDAYLKLAATVGEAFAWPR